MNHTSRTATIFIFGINDWISETRMHRHICHLEGFQQLLTSRETNLSLCTFFASKVLLEMLIVVKSGWRLKTYKSFLSRHREREAV